MNIWRMSNANLRYRKADISDLEEIWDLHKITYGKYEPMNIALGDMEDCITYYGVLERLLLQKASFVAIDDQTDRIVGYVMNEIIEPHHPTIYEDVCEKYADRETEERKKKNKIIITFLDGLSGEFFDKFDAKKKFINAIGGVHIDYSKKGIHAKLLNLLELSAMENHCDIIYAQATSTYSQANFEKLGYAVYATRYYKDFLYNGEKVWPDVIGGAHDSAKLYYKELSNPKPTA